MGLSYLDTSHLKLWHQENASPASSSVWPPLPPSIFVADVAGLLKEQCLHSFHVTCRIDLKGGESVFISLPAVHFKTILPPFMQGEPRALVTTGVTWLASLNPTQSGQLQNKKTTQACPPAGLLPSKPHLYPRQGGLPLPPCLGDWTQLFSDVGDLGPDFPTWIRVCGSRWAVYRAWAPNQEMAWLELCLPQTPWSPVSKKQKQDLSVPWSCGDHLVAALD